MTDDAEDERADGAGEREEGDVLDPETRAAFERSYDRHKAAMERLAEL